MMSAQLDNLVKIGLLEEELLVQVEFDGLFKTGSAKLKDSEITSLSLESRFELSYAAAHAFALAALRWHGYRAKNRYAVFQALAHTTKMSKTQIRVLSDAHEKRNRSAYDGESDVTEAMVAAIVQATIELQKQVTKLGPVKP